MSTATVKTFNADAVLFDMDGTLTDSIQAVEAAWGKVALDIGEDPEHVIAATHGKRAVDNLAQFKPSIKPHEMDDEVTKFEESILFFADAYKSHGPGSRRNSMALSSGAATPALSNGSSEAISRASFAQPPPGAQDGRRPSFATRLGSALGMSAIPEPAVYEPTFEEEDDEIWGDEWDPKAYEHFMSAWQIEAAQVDRAVQILPGVKELISCLPEGRYAVATSGAKTYAYGCMTRVGITPPKVTITADDKRLKAGKPAPDPFLLAAKCLGYSAKRCVVFEDSPSGIKAGVASGATVIAVCTSHERSKIEGLGAHYIVENMNSIKVRFDGEQLVFDILE
ncbi:HAD-like protein [Cylindrobasidium torrendii FP15055 ss-10]|uniref:HAD-like protein n=1 Tax=Cylindrobasidium torrendii FP15055 ss-10 TaxID=1314674 RepID=A0A0D7BP06_9AGAR|nr:HAD-like protein [Cylindrobasidium torrendii FP15055 ss-10]